MCLSGTDTGLAFVGEAEWAIAGMMRLGIPQEQASVMLSDATGCDPGKVPDGTITVPLRVCEGCAGEADLEVGLIATGMPSYGVSHP